MKYALVVLVLVFTLGLTACGGPAQEGDLSDTQVQEELPQQVADVEDSVNEIEGVDDELSLDELDGLDEELDTI